MDPSTPDYDIVVDENVMVPMRDGVRLATDIYRPAVDGQAIPAPSPPSSAAPRMTSGGGGSGSTPSPATSPPEGMSW